MQASERSAGALERMESFGSAADQAMTDQLAPMQSQLDRLLILQHELVQRNNALRQSHKTLLVERNVYLRKVIDLENLIKKPEKVTNNQHRMAINICSIAKNKLAFTLSIKFAL